MHVGLIANTGWLDEELPLFRQLVVGLLDESVQVAQVVPHELDTADVSAFGERVPWSDTRWRYLRSRRLLKQAPGLRDAGVDLLHALDGRVWGGATRLAVKLDLPLVVTAQSGMDVPAAQWVVRHAGASRVAMIGTTRPVAEALRERVDPAVTVGHVPPGVLLPEAESRTRQRTDALCAVVSGNGVWDGQYEALCCALARIARDYPQSQFFFDGQGSDQQRVWQGARRYDLLPNLSMIPRKLGHRELLLGADLLIHPQALGRSRGLTLMAMARQLPVLAVEDPWLDYLRDGETAWVLGDPDADAWEQKLRQIIEEPEAGQELGERARGYIAEHHAGSTHVARTVELYRNLAGEAIPFPT